MNSKRTCAIFISTFTTFPLLLDLHLLRLHVLFVLFMFSFYLYRSIAEGLPIHIILADIIYLLIVEALHLSCYVGLYKFIRFFIEILRIYINLMMSRYDN